MSQVQAALDAAWRVLLVGVLLGAGLPTLFALGIRAMAWGTGGEAEIHGVGELPKPHPIGRWIAYALFGFVVFCVLLGIGYIVAHGLGMTITFNGILPVFTPKG
jgi:hypothetical protein